VTGAPALPRTAPAGPPSARRRDLPRPGGVQTRRARTVAAVFSALVREAERATGDGRRWDGIDHYEPATT
jgi:hypothetical protein